MLIRPPSEIPSSEITRELLFWNRRSFIKAAGLGAAAVTLLPRGYDFRTFRTDFELVPDVPGAVW